MTLDRPDFIEDIRRAAQNTTHQQRMQFLQRSKLEDYPEKQLFHIKTADQWLKEEYSKPAARRLLGTLWHEHELCILFADTNVGKSILAVQIGWYLARQGSMEPFENHVNENLKVLYIDFELNALQFKTRYTDRIADALHFGENFVRAEFNPGGDDPAMYDNYADYVQRKIDYAIRTTKANVVIIDNITCMDTATGNAAAVLPLMKSLKALKTKYKLSMLILAHTPKRNQLKPITVDDLQGSKMIINFADSAFAIGQSQLNSGMRYIKQIKQRNTGSDYGADHVVLFNIAKQENFLAFQFLGYDTEQAHLQRPGVAITDEIKVRIVELNRQGLSSRQVADHLKISATTVQRVLNKVKEG